MIIDFHTHTFPEKIAASTLNALGNAAHIKPFTNGTESGLLVSMKEAAIDYSVTFPVATKVGQVEKLNHRIIEKKEENLAKGLIYFGSMHPDYEDYKAELKRLAEAKIPGIKLHPAYQATDFNDIRMMRIVEYACELGLIVLIHAGIDIGIPDHNYASVEHILEVMKAVQPDKLVLAHMGGWGCWDAVEKHLAGAPLYLDTSCSLRLESFHEDWKSNPQYKDHLSEEAFVRLCKKHGTDRILFATDSPWQHQTEYVSAIQAMDFSDVEKEMIFSQNAVKLLNLNL